MALDWLTDPVSDDAPCGPDLEATDDDGFLDYYYEAESRMPERYFTPSGAEKDGVTPGTVFERKSIDLKSERAQIEALLKKSRDLRLLSLYARMGALAGDLASFADAVVGIADVLETFPNQAHPQNQSDRRGALDELGNSTLMIFPLQYAELAGSAEVSLRRYQVATGAASAREGEAGLSASSLVSELGAPSSSKAVEASHAAITRAASALNRIKKGCLLLDTPFNPDLETTIETVDAIQALIQQGRNDLQPWSEAPPEEEEAEVEEDGGEAGEDDAPAAAGSSQSQTVTVQVTKLPNRPAAVQTLTALELYFATHEPASPALLLITQARLLVGKPLIEAFQTLLPGHADRTRIDLGDTGFVMDMGRLQMLAQESIQLANPNDEDPGEPPVITNRAEATGHLSAVEQFFRAREPASPIPVLIFRARTYLEKDFSALVAELIPPQPTGEE